MPKLTWTAMMDRHPRAHLVVGELEPGSRLSPTHPMADLVKALGTKGDYALVMDGRRALQVAFASKADADRLALALNARTSGRKPGWASQRYFILDADTASRIDKALRDLFVD